MKKKLWLAIGLLALFALWTLLVCVVDVSPIGQQDTAVGLSTWNEWFHQWTGVHMVLYVLTDWLGLVPVIIGFGFAVFGLWQWIKRRRLRMVDRDLLFLGGFYIVVIAVYLLFENVVINYRPILIEGVLEASYPSSTTLLVMCVMITAIKPLCCRVRHGGVSRLFRIGIYTFTVLMVLGRMVSGVHWLSDIIGGLLLSGGLLSLYNGICDNK